MKMKKLFLAALAVATLASCSKEGADVNSGDGDVVNAKLKISFASNTKASVGDYDTDTYGVTIEDANLFVINASGAIQARYYIPKADINKTVPNAPEYAVTTAAKKVVIISNTGNLIGTGGVAETVNTLSQLEAVYGKLQALMAAYGGTTPQIWMSGIGDVSAFSGASIEHPGEKLATATVNLKLIPARIDVKVVNKMTNKGELIKPTIKIEGVAVLYSAAYTHLVSPDYTQPFPSFIAAENTAVEALYYRSGVEAPYWDVHSLKDSYSSSLVKLWDGGPAADAVSDFKGTFYALPGAGVDNGRNTILTVYGDFNGTRLYFPVIFSTDEMSTTNAQHELLKNGKRYELNITLSGDATNGGGGTTDPETPVVNAYMTVTVTPGEWNVAVPFEKEFN